MHGRAESRRARARRPGRPCPARRCRTPRSARGSARGTGSARSRGRGRRRERRGEARARRPRRAPRRRRRRASAASRRRAPRRVRLLELRARRRAALASRAANSASAAAYCVGRRRAGVEAVERACPMRSRSRGSKTSAPRALDRVGDQQLGPIAARVSRRSSVVAERARRRCRHSAPTAQPNARTLASRSPRSETWSTQVSDWILLWSTIARDLAEALVGRLAERLPELALLQLAVAGQITNTRRRPPCRRAARANPLAFETPMPSEPVFVCTSGTAAMSGCPGSPPSAAQPVEQLEVELARACEHGVDARARRGPSTRSRRRRRRGPPGAATRACP